MKTSTSSLSVNRLLSFVFTLSILIFSGNSGVFAQIAASKNQGIQYASLKASATEKAVFINWTTISEQNNNHFEVERSTDLKAFKTVAMVLDGFDATGTNGKAYKFKEAAGEIAKGKTVYYRLKQVDNDNLVHYSEVMAVQVNTTVIVFPKPDNSQVKINSKSTFINSQSGYPNNQKLLSKQTTISMGETGTPAAGSVELTAGVLNAFELILGTELYTPKLILA
jgi:hypothetical protein